MRRPNLRLSRRTVVIAVLYVFLCNVLAQDALLNMKHEEESVGDVGSNTQMLPFHVLPVYGNASLGYYYVKIYIGSPSLQPQTVIVDTGSGILAVPCTDCTQCGRHHLNPPYNPANSTASHQITCGEKHPSCVDKCRHQPQNINCTFQIHYAEGSSLAGRMIEDEIRFETFSAKEQIRAVLGCTQKQTNLFVTQKANGIFGLAPSRESNLLQKLIEQHSGHSGEKKEFSLCLSSNGGLMTVGGRNTNLHAVDEKPLLSIGYRADHNLYGLIGIQEISLDETLIFTSLSDRFTGYGIFIDSGSTFSYLPRKKYEILEHKLNQTCTESKRCRIGQGQDSICYQLELAHGQHLVEEVDKLFPTIKYKIQNKYISWKPTKYFLVREEEKHEVCLGILPLDRYLLGANWMYDRDITFDLNNEMIHIYDEVKCEKDSKIMGRYLDNVSTSVNITFFNSTTLFKVNVNTKEPMFVLGIIFLTLACLGFIIMIFGICVSSQKKQVASNMPVSQEDRESDHLQDSGEESSSTEISDTSNF